METLEITQDQLAAEIEELRGRFPRTQDLYREVCILLFFRRGITPTANKLYQLVRKGSMSAPAEALNDFWDTLRERSRVTVEHADLPDELQTAAGEMVASLWKSAQTMARDGLIQSKLEAAAVVDAALASEAKAKASHAQALEDIELIRANLVASENLAGQLRQELAAAVATNSSLEARLEDFRRHLAEAQGRLERAHEDHACEREKLAERSRLAEQRFAEMEKRALLEIDRERTASAKLQKTLESERAEHAKLIDRLRSDYNEAQRSFGALREQTGALQQANAALREERDRSLGEAQSTRAQLETAIRQAAAATTRADHAVAELERVRASVVHESPVVTSKRSASDASGKRRRKVGAGAG